MIGLGVLLMAVLMLSAYGHQAAVAIRDHADKQSLERRFAASQAVITAMSTILSGVAFGIVLGLLGQQEPSVVLILFSISWLPTLVSDLKDDDWLDGQGQQLKDTFKNARDRLVATLSPRLS